MKITDLKNYTVVSSGASSAPQDTQEAPKGFLGTNPNDSAYGKVIDNSITRGIQKVFPGSKVGEAAGTSMAALGQYAKGNAKGAQDILDTQVKPLQVGADAAQIGLTFAPAGPASRIGKVAMGAATGYSYDVTGKLEQGNPLSQSLTPGLGTVVGTAIPVAGAVIKPTTAIVQRLLKGLGSGLSGVSTDTIDKIVSNPEMAQRATDKLAKSGNDSVLRDNAQTIVKGISDVRKNARSAFGEAMSQLKKEDIDPKKFRDSIQPVLDSFGASSKSGIRSLKNVEFSDPKNLKKAAGLVGELSKTDLDGLSLRRLVDKIDSSKYKVATGDERLSFNAFLKNLSDGVKNAINGSTGKLQEANNAFSKDMQLVEVMQKTFGKVNFKNLPEVVKASQKLETIFSQKGLAPAEVDNFLKKIGISPSEFKTAEAVRQISNKSSGANSTGVTMGEVMRETTSAILTPQKIRDLSIKTGLASQKIEGFLKDMKPVARNLFINALLKSSE